MHSTVWNAPTNRLLHQCPHLFILVELSKAVGGERAQALATGRAQLLKHVIDMSHGAVPLVRRAEVSLRPCCRVGRAESREVMFEVKGLRESVTATLM